MSDIDVKNLSSILKELQLEELNVLGCHKEVITYLKECTSYEGMSIITGLSSDNAFENYYKLCNYLLELCECPNEEKKDNIHLQKKRTKELLKLNAMDNYTKYIY